MSRSHTVVDGRTILSESYAPYGVLTPLPEPPEPTEAEREAARRAALMTEAELLADRGWSAADLADAIARYGFPAGRAALSSRFSIFGATLTRTWPRAAVAAWADGLARLVGGGR